MLVVGSSESGAAMVSRNLMLHAVRPFVGKSVIKVLTGLRRSGKSVLLGQIQDMIQREIDPGAPVLYLDLDDEANADCLGKGVLYAKMQKALDDTPGRKTYFFLDEVHDAEGWERAVNSIQKRKNADIYITGSNSKLLSGELASYLTGRYVEFNVTPFSYSEFLEASGLEVGEASLLRYLEFGGLPFLSEIGYQPEPSKRYLRDVFSAILLKDVVKRRKIRDVVLLERIVRFAMTETGHVFSARRIVDFLRHERIVTAPSTVLNYLEACEEAFLVSKAEREDLIGKRILSVDEKYYVGDCGLRNANVSSDLSRDIDQLLEAAVYHEMRRRGWKVTIGRVREKEVDFVCEKDTQRLYLQVAYLMPTEETRQREFGALLSVPDQFAKMVLTMDRVDFSSNGIVHRYLPEFLAAPTGI